MKWIYKYTISGSEKSLSHDWPKLAIPWKTITVYFSYSFTLVQSPPISQCQRQGRKHDKSLEPLNSATLLTFIHMQVEKKKERKKDYLLIFLCVVCVYLNEHLDS